ncbi:hypothetical protein P9597_17620 [Aneurinibacillus migulanus]|nr:hypothetical protein [Aneurinibacillus migulanus]
MHASACSLVFFSQGRLCGAKAGPAKHMGLSVRETNRRSFGARRGGYPG